MLSPRLEIASRLLAGKIGDCTTCEVRDALELADELISKDAETSGFRKFDHDDLEDLMRESTMVRGGLTLSECQPIIDFINNWAKEKLGI